MVEEEVVVGVYVEEHDLFKLQKPSKEVILI
jgi:hypothetical protein